MKIKRILSRALSYGALLVLFVSGTGVLAQEGQAPGSGLQITRPRYELSIQPGASTTFNIELKNVSGGDIVARAIVNDFEADDDTGAPRINPDVTQETPTSIKSFLRGVEDVPLANNETKELTITLDVPAEASPGAYYGIIRYQAVPVNGDQDQGQVSLTASVGSIVLLEVPGNITKSMTLERLEAERDGKTGSFFFFRAPNEAVLGVKNTGNTFIKPFGRVTISKSGSEVSNYELNNTDPPGNVLPDSLRNFRNPIENVGSFGRYTMVANIGFDEGSEVLTITGSFWVIPLWAVILAVVLLILILAGVFIVRRKTRDHRRFRR